MNIPGPLASGATQDGRTGPTRVAPNEATERWRGLDAAPDPVQSKEETVALKAETVNTCWRTRIIVEDLDAGHQPAPDHDILYRDRPDRPADLCR